MLVAVSGKQRAGKTFFVVTLIMKYLVETKRPIYTNLPIHPDKICRKASFRRPYMFNEYLSRINLFRDFKGRKNVKDFIEKNPIYWNLKPVGKPHPLVFDKNMIMDFWNHTQANCIMFMDETYQFFSAGDALERSKRRTELLHYSRQHGHFKDDLYLISHSVNDLDMHIRRGIQYQYIVANSKYSNMFQSKFLKGMRWPIQFFIINGYEYGESEVSDSFNLFPDKTIFECYDSFSPAESLSKVVSSSDAKSQDSHIDHCENIKRFLRNSLWPISYLLAIGCAIWFGFSSIMALSGSFQPKKNNEVIEKNIERFKPKTITGNRIVYSDGTIIKKGDIIDGFKIVKVGKICLVGSADGKLFKVKADGLGKPIKPKSKN